jgi:sugar-specific transcriptional regulator TrmB
MRDLLKKLGFSEKETDVYLGAFKLGSGPISSLARQTKIKRPTVYVILEKLKKMGLVVSEKKDNKQIFIVQNPQNLLKIINDRKKTLEEKEEKLKKALPQLKTMARKESYIPSVRYYEGKEGVWNIVDDLIEARSEAWLIVPGKIYDVLGVNRMMKEVIDKRTQMQKKAHLISDHHPENIKSWRLNETDVREYRFVPKEIELNTTVYIYADKVSITFWGEPTSGLIIKSKELFQVMKFLYNSLWKELEGENLPKE